MGPILIQPGSAVGLGRRCPGGAVQGSRGVLVRTPAPNGRLLPCCGGPGGAGGPAPPSSCVCAVAPPAPEASRMWLPLPPWQPRGDWGEPRWDSPGARARPGAASSPSGVVQGGCFSPSSKLAGAASNPRALILQCSAAFFYVKVFALGGGRDLSCPLLASSRDHARTDACMRVSCRTPARW